MTKSVLLSLILLVLVSSVSGILINDGVVVNQFTFRNSIEFDEVFVGDDFVKFNDHVLLFGYVGNIYFNVYSWNETDNLLGVYTDTPQNLVFDISDGSLVFNVKSDNIVYNDSFSVGLSERNFSYGLFEEVVVIRPPGTTAPPPVTAGVVGVPDVVRGTLWEKVFYWLLFLLMIIIILIYIRKSRKRKMLRRNYYEEKF